ncbi:hypothetical protein C3492_14025 [Streptomyces sp. Ru62]|uniref:hypothetical protein n=1 Tax=Streptomyces sp. Ru62 TaxID=2080745 RepID=UPI000CDD73C9|nr:hypothetical protein [Streptomyces sp. Ru62]POX62807.1 hypothetical protein C3492_14025 [Streptomyces sp. Ru62]
MAGAVEADATITMADARDGAEVAAALLVEGDHRRETVLTTGREALSSADCAALVGKAASKDVPCHHVPAQQVLDGLLATGLPDWPAEALPALQQMYDTGELNPDSDGVQPTARRGTQQGPRSRE